MALLVSQTIWEFFPSDHEAVQPCVLCSYSIIPNSRTNRWPVKAQLLSSLSTKFIVMDPLGLDPTHPWAQSENCDPTIGAVCGKLLVRWWVQRLVKAGSSPLGEVMMVSLLYHKRRTARWFTAQQASDIMCMACAPTRGQTLANLVAGPIGPRLREVAAARSNSKGLRGGTSSGR